MGHEDPVGFIESTMGGTLWETQRAIVRAVFSAPHARVAVKACHASGKTHVAAAVNSDAERIDNKDFFHLRFLWNSAILRLTSASVI